VEDRSPTEFALTPFRCLTQAERRGGPADPTWSATNTDNISVCHHVIYCNRCQLFVVARSCRVRSRQRMGLPAVDARPIGSHITASSR
jgi:hypothetical protein